MLELLELDRAVAVVAAEVDGFRHLGVGFGERLARLGGHRLDQPAAIGAEGDARVVQHAAAIRCAPVAPGGCGLDNAADPAFHGRDVVDEVAREGAVADVAGCGACEDACGPLAVLGQGGVGVGLVEEAVVGGRILDGHIETAAAILPPGAHRGGHGILFGHQRQRLEEPVALEFERLEVFADRSRAVQEVLVSGVLLEPAHEVDDRGIEVARVHDRRVQQHLRRIGPDRLDVLGAHAEQHLDVDAVLRAGPLSELEGVGDVEQVVARDADAHCRGVLGQQREAEHALEVRIGCGLVGDGRERPAANRGLDTLHRQVRALHEPHADAGPTCRDPLASPGGQLLKRAERIGVIGLQHDACLKGVQLGVGEHALEHRHRDIEIVVARDVERDQLRLRGRRGQPIQRRDPLHEMLDGLVEGPQVRIGHE